MKVIINENNAKGILLKLWKENPYLDPIQMKMFGLSVNNVSVLNMFPEHIEHHGSWQIRIKCWLDSENGSVVLIHDDNNVRRSLDSLLHNEDIRWEIRMEIEDCIGDWINDNIKLSYYTGLLMLIDLDYV